MGCFDKETNNLLFLDFLCQNEKLWICGCGKGDEKLWKLFDLLYNQRRKAVYIIYFFSSPFINAHLVFVIFFPILSLHPYTLLLFCMFCMIYNQTTFLPHVFIQHSLFSCQVVSLWMIVGGFMKENNGQRGWSKLLRLTKYIYYKEWKRCLCGMDARSLCTKH